MIYGIDAGNNRVQKFDSNGTIIAKWGSFGSSYGQFEYPINIAIDSGVPQSFMDAGNAGDVGVLFDSDYLAQGITFQFTFDEPGKYPFYDKVDNNL
jgi:hypothetical protein